MKLKILAPHQTINGTEIAPGDTAEVDNLTIARNLITSGYAVEVPAETTKTATFGADTTFKTADNFKTTNREAGK